MPRLIIDSHLDLAWCAVYFNRDLTLDVDAIRARESHMSDERARGKNVLSLGILGALFGLPVDSIRAAVKRRFGKKAAGLIKGRPVF